MLAVTDTHASVFGGFVTHLATLNSSVLLLLLFLSLVLVSASEQLWNTASMYVGGMNSEIIATQRARIGMMCCSKENIPSTNPSMNDILISSSTARLSTTGTGKFTCTSPSWAKSLALALTLTGLFEADWPDM